MNKIIVGTFATLATMVLSASAFANDSGAATGVSAENMSIVESEANTTKLGSTYCSTSSSYAIRNIVPRVGHTLQRWNGTYNGGVDVTIDGVSVWVHCACGIVNNICYTSEYAVNAGLCQAGCGDHC